MDWWQLTALMIGSGGVGAIVTNLTIERMRWRREDAVHWKDERKKLYVDMLTAISIALEALSLYAIAGLAEDNGRIKATVGEVSKELRKQVNEAQLIAGLGVRNTADKLDALVRLATITLFAEDADELRRIASEIGELRDELVKSCRDDLKIEAG